MIYEISGKYKEFTFEAENDLIALTITYLISSDGSVYVKQPSLNQPTYIDKDFVNRIKAIYSPKTQKEYVEENKEIIKQSLLKYLPGSLFKRQETLQIIKDAENLTIEEKKDFFVLLKQTYMTDDLHMQLEDRIRKIISILNYKKDEIT
jgi:hypothetical protein